MPDEWWRPITVLKGGNEPTSVMSLRQTRNRARTDMVIYKRASGGRRLYRFADRRRLEVLGWPRRVDSPTPTKETTFVIVRYASVAFTEHVSTDE